MGEMHEIGTVLSGKDIAIDLAPLARSVSMEELADALHLSVDQVLLAIIDRPANVFAMRQLFKDVVVDDGEFPADDPGLRTILRIKALGGPLLDVPPEQWPVPMRELRLPYSPVFETQLREIRQTDPSRLTQFTVGDRVFLQEEIELLEKHTKRLRGHLRAERKVLEENARQVGILEKMRRILEIQADEHVDTTSMEAVRAGQLLDEVNGLLRTSRETLLRDVRTHFRKPAETNLQQNEADTLLGLFENQELIRIVQVATADPSLVPKALIERLLRVLADAVKLVLLSPRSEEVKEDHVYPALLAYARQEVPGVSEAIAALTDTTLREHVESKWEDTLTDLARKDPKKQIFKSLLANAAEAAPVYGTATSIMVGVLEVIGPELISSAYKRFGQGAGVGGFLTRFVIVGGTLNSGQRASAMMEFASALDHADPKRRIEEIRKLQLHDKMFKGELGVGLAMIANTIVFVMVLGKDQDKSFKDSLELASAVLAAGETAADAFALAAKLRDVTKGRRVLALSSKVLGKLSATLGIVVTAIDLKERVEKFQHEAAIIDVLSLTGAGLTVASWVLGIEALAGTFGSLALAAPSLGLIGAVLAGVALAAVIVVHITTPGLQALFDAYLDALTKSGSPVVEKTAGKALENSVNLVRITFSQARSADSFTTLDATSTEILRAHRLGLSKDDCVVAFKSASAVEAILG